MQNIYFIPVRKNSKEIPNKNMKKLLEIPLISYPLNSLLKANVQGSIWVAADCAKLKKYVKDLYGDKVLIFDRDSKNT